jgi:hypothetical protein
MPVLTIKLTVRISINDQGNVVEEVDPNSAEFQEVSARFFERSCEDSGPAVLSAIVTKVERVQNKPQWQRYFNTRRIVAQENGGDPNERYPC